VAMARIAMIQPDVISIMGGRGQNSDFSVGPRIYSASRNIAQQNIEFPEDGFPYHGCPAGVAPLHHQELPRAARKNNTRQSTATNAIDLPAFQNVPARVNPLAEIE
jgi:hypothetical protein